MSTETKPPIAIAGTSGGRRMEQLLKEPNSLNSNGLAVYLSHGNDSGDSDWKVCLSDITGQAVYVDMADIDEVIATLAACRRHHDRNRPQMDQQWAEWVTTVDEARRKAGPPYSSAPTNVGR